MRVSTASMTARCSAFRVGSFRARFAKESTEKVRIYDHGIDTPDYASYGEALTLRFGDIVSPRLDLREPLRLEAEHRAVAPAELHQLVV